MFRLRTVWLAAMGAGVLVCCLALLVPALTASGRGAAGAPGPGSTTIPRTARTPGATPGTARTAEAVRASELARRDSLAACEQRLERTARQIPTVAIVGASYTAGVGPHNPQLSWAVQLARTLRWNAVVYGVPGAGYVSAAAGGQGPVVRMLARENLAALDPALVIVQAGHDDVGVPAAIEQARVRQAIAYIRATAPHARIALLTVFAGRFPADPAALYRTDRAIVSAAGAAIIMDPLAGHWGYQRLNGGLHPTAGGDAWIAGKVAAILSAHGVYPANMAGKDTGASPEGAAESDPVICYSAAGLGHHGEAAVGSAPSDA